MSRKTRLAGLIATATMFVFALGASGSGALAQNNEASPIAVPVLVEPALQQEAGPETRFVAQEVVQPLPQEPNEAEILAHADTLRELVSDMPGTFELSDDLQCLASAIYFEARGEPLAGQLAVARVIVNRTASPLFPDDYCSVVTQRGQFSFVRHGNIPAPNESSTAWQRARVIARIAHEELWDSEANDALFFHATHVRPRWSRVKVALATIDSHIFYR